MTSNLGSQYIQQQIQLLNNGNNEEVIEQTKNQVMEMLKKTIRPEFLNRIDETIMFLPLTKDQISNIVRLQLEKVRDMIKEQGYALEWTDKAIEQLATLGYDPEFGARPVKRAIQRYMLNDLSKAILAGTVSTQTAIMIDSDGKAITFRNV